MLDSYVGRELHEQAGVAYAHVQRVKDLSVVEPIGRAHSSRTAETSPGQRTYA